MVTTELLTKTSETNEPARYRRTFPSHWECADTWSRLLQPYGESGPLSFRGGVMYSYNTPIARLVQRVGLLNNVFCLSDPDRHSMTTVSKHKPPTLGAAVARGYNIFDAYDIMADDEEGHLRNRRAIEKAALLRLPTAKRAFKANRKERVSMVLWHMDEARRYAVAVGLESGQGDVRSVWGSQSAGLMLNQLYADLEWSVCPIIADAIEEAGCDDDEVLSVLRSL